MNNYIINESTIAVISNKNSTQILEKYQSLNIRDKAINIIDNSCKYYGSSFLGRCSATEYLIGIKYKCPIIISEVKEIIFFPTASYKNEECLWINYKSVKKYYTNNDQQLEIEFTNSKKIIINLSNRVFCNQIFKSSRLESILRSKK